VELNEQRHARLIAQPLVLALFVIGHRAAL
jgi:hypothetical protein